MMARRTKTAKRLTTRTRAMRMRERYGVCMWWCECGHASMHDSELRPEHATPENADDEMNAVGDSERTVDGQAGESEQHSE